MGGQVSLLKSLDSQAEDWGKTLRHRRLDDDEATTLSDIVVSSPFLKKLDLMNNHIQDEGAIELATAIGKHPSLLSVNLQYNLVAEKGAIALGRALRFNETLSSLDLQFNCIGDEGWIGLLRNLENNSALVTLKYNGNRISPPVKLLIDHFLSRREVEKRKIKRKLEIMDYLSQSPNFLLSWLGVFTYSHLSSLLS